MGSKQTANCTFSSRDIELQYASSSKKVTYTCDGDGVIEVTSSDTNIATVSLNTTTKEITITPVNAGNCEVNFRMTKTDNYYEYRDRILVHVKPLPVSLSWDADTFTYDRQI